MAHILFGLIAHPDELSLPIVKAADEAASHAESDKVVAAMRGAAAAGRPPVAMFAKRLIKPVALPVFGGGVGLWITLRVWGVLHSAWWIPVCVLWAVAVLCWRQTRRIKEWTANHTQNEYADFSNLKAEPTYQDAALLARAWDLPVARHYRPASHGGDGSAAIFYQPLSGYCGYATANTLIGSIAHATRGTATALGLLTYPDRLQYVSAEGMMRLLRRVAQRENGVDFGFDSVELLTGLPYDAFLRHITTGLNDPQYRYAVIFHRSPLFFCHDKALRAKSIMAVHWSPVAGYLTAEDRVLLLDVNDAYGPFLLSPKRLYDAVNVRDYIDGSFMGLIRVKVRDA